MRTIMVTLGKPAATVGDGIPVDAKGETIGFDTFFEIEPDKWVQEVPSELIAKERAAGTLKSGVVYNGKIYDRLNINDVCDRLIASIHKLPLKAQRELGDPLKQLEQNIRNIKVQLLGIRIQELETEVQTKANKRKQLEFRIKRLKKMVDKQMPTEPHVPSPFPPELNLKAALESLCKASEVINCIQTEYIEPDDPNGLMSDPKSVEKLRKIMLG